MTNVVFQGDSLTEAMRWHDYPYHMGSGYAFLVAAEYETKFPNRFHFVNRGNGGDKSEQVLARIKEDGIDHNPDILSVLMGVNDVWHRLDHNVPYTVEHYIKCYTDLIEKVKAACPDTKFILAEPYIRLGYATENTEAEPDRWHLFRSGVEERAAATVEIAKKYGAEFVPLQADFDRLAELYGDRYLTLDGAHPTPAGHALIAANWKKAFEKLI